MTVKERLYVFITKDKPQSFNDWKKFQSTCPQVRIKTVGSKRAVLISLEEHGEWFEPVVWAANYRASIKLRLIQEISRAKNILSQQALEEVVGFKPREVEVKAAPTDELEVRKSFVLGYAALMEEDSDVLQEFIRYSDAAVLLETMITYAFKAAELKVNTDFVLSTVRDVLKR